MIQATQIQSIRPSAVAATAPTAQQQRRNQAAQQDVPRLGQFSESTLQNARLYRPAQQGMLSIRTQSPSPLQKIRVWAQAVSNVASGNTTYDESALPVQMAVSEEKSAQHAQVEVEPYTGCKTCESRVYQDESGDAGVTFQAPKGLPSSTAALFVAAHEGQHATRESARARENGETIANKTVTLQMGCCPECHKMYVKGGTTSITKIENKGSGDAVVTQAAGLAGGLGQKLDMEV